MCMSWAMMDHKLGLEENEEPRPLLALPGEPINCMALPYPSQSNLLYVLFYCSPTDHLLRLRKLHAYVRSCPLTCLVAW